MMRPNNFARASTPVLPLARLLSIKWSNRLAKLAKRASESLEEIYHQLNRCSWCGARTYYDPNDNCCETCPKGWE